MSLMGTLAKVAIGVAVAKGVSSMAKGAAGGGGLLGGGASSGRVSSGGGLEDMMGEILGGRGGSGRTAGASTGGIGGLLDELAGMAGGTTGQKTSGTRTATRQPDLGDLLGQLTGGSAGGASGAGGLGDLIGSLAGGGAAGGLGGLLGGMLGGSGGGSLGDMLNSAFANGGEPDATPAPAQELAAAVLLKAMIQAAKSDGKIDAGEQAKLMNKLGDVSAQERAFLEKELAAPIDVQGLAAQIPGGLEAQAYTMSVMAIDLDSQAEAQYLHQFASALGLKPAQVNHIHEQLGVPKLYA